MSWLCCFRRRKDSPPNCTTPLNNESDGRCASSVLGSPTHAQSRTSADVHLPRFIYLCRLGSGAFGTVSLLLRRADVISEKNIPSHTMLVAVKRINRQRLEQMGFEVEGIFSERFISDKVEHPFVPKLALACRTAQDFYIGYPFFLGGDLGMSLQRKAERPSPTTINTPASLDELLSSEWSVASKGLPFSFVVLVAFELLSAIAHLNAKGWSHNDVKPDNVFLNHDGHVALADFSMVRREGSFSSPAATRPTVVVSTLRAQDYLPPECSPAVTTPVTDHRCVSDIWSYGVTILELALGEHPFGDGRFQKAQAIARGGPFKLLPVFEPETEFHRQFLTVVHRFNSLMKRCLVRERSERPLAVELLSDPFFSDATVRAIVGCDRISIDPSKFWSNVVEQRALHPTKSLTPAQHCAHGGYASKDLIRSFLERVAGDLPSAHNADENDEEKDGSYFSPVTGGPLNRSLANLREAEELRRDVQRRAFRSRRSVARVPLGNNRTSSRVVDSASNTVREQIGDSCILTSQKGEEEGESIGMSFGENPFARENSDLGSSRFTQLQSLLLSEAPDSNFFPVDMRYFTDSEEEWKGWNGAKNRARLCSFDSQWRGDSSCPPSRTSEINSANFRTPNPTDPRLQAGSAQWQNTFTFIEGK